MSDGLHVRTKRIKYKHGLKDTAFKAPVALRKSYVMIRGTISEKSYDWSFVLKTKGSSRKYNHFTSHNNLLEQ